MSWIDDGLKRNDQYGKFMENGDGELGIFDGSIAVDGAMIDIKLGILPFEF